MPSPYPYETATPEQRKVGAWWWCVDHEVHVEMLTEPVELLVEYIMEHGAVGGRERRLAEMRPVINPHRLPKKLVEAGRACHEAGRACDEAGRACDEPGRAYNEAWHAYNAALRVCEPELMALHREEYPDTRWDGKSIFGKEASDG